jgi:hypothetical protein
MSWIVKHSDSRLNMRIEHAIALLFSVLFSHQKGAKNIVHSGGVMIHLVSVVKRETKENSSSKCSLISLKFNFQLTTVHFW